MTFSNRARRSGEAVGAICQHFGRRQLRQVLVNLSFVPKRFIRIICRPLENGAFDGLKDDPEESQAGAILFADQENAQSIFAQHSAKTAPAFGSAPVAKVIPNALSPVTETSDGRYVHRVYCPTKEGSAEAMVRHAALSTSGQMARKHKTLSPTRNRIPNVGIRPKRGGKVLPACSTQPADDCY